MTFDPYAPTSDSPEDKFRSTLVARAKKRHVTAHQDYWHVRGDPKLGDTQPDYPVRFDSATNHYVCRCYSTHHGSTRRSRICSHVLAVILHRRANPVRSASSNLRSEGESADREVGPSLPEDAPPTAQISPADVHWTRHGDPPLPDKFESFQPHQIAAYEQIMAAFEHADIVMVDAPTGSGKTIIGEMVRRGMGTKALYICHSKSLQEQFAADFPYCKVLKGRSNYSTQLASFPDTTCADCTRTPADDGCAWCSDPIICEYPIAKTRALTARLSVLNTAYLLAEANHVGGMSNRDFIIIDECDTLERELMSYIQFEVSDYRLKALGPTAPIKGSHKTTIATWMETELLPAVTTAYKKLPPRPRDVTTIRRKAGLNSLRREIERIVPELRGEDSLNWVRDNGAGPMVLKPVRVDRQAKDAVWRHGKKFLLMSATIVSADQLAEDLGIESAGLKWELVRVPHTFPIENRRIHVRPIADMAQKHRASGSWDRMADGIRLILADHPNERVLVHTVSYQLAGHLRDRLAGSGRPVLTYRSASERDAAIAQFRRSESAVLVAPSLDRGVDFRDDDCRVVIVAKVPFPYLGDDQVSTRMRTKGGRQWYSCQTVRTLVQMTGRGVRSEKDWCKTYILDSQFLDNIWKKSRQLLPQWFRDAIVMEGR